MKVHARSHPVTVKFNEIKAAVLVELTQSFTAIRGPPSYWAAVIITTTLLNYFNSNMAWPPATYDIIIKTHNHRNWPSLNLSQNECEGLTDSYWKCTSGADKNSEKPQGEPFPPSHPSCTSEG